MTRYLLDTDALIDFSKGVTLAAPRILSWIDGNEVVAVCSISVAEFYAGLNPDQARQWEPFITSLAYWEVSAVAAMRAGQDRAALTRSGTSITDCLIAACAREHDATVVTANIRHFPMADVAVLAVRDAP